MGQSLSGRKSSARTFRRGDKVAGKIAPLVTECQRQVENCLYTSTALFEVIKWHEKIRVWGAAVPFVLGSLATWGVLADAGVPWLKYVTAAFAFLSGLIPALLTTVKFNEGLDRCKATACEFKNLQDRFRQAAQITAHKGLVEFDKELRLLMDRMEAVRKECVMVPQWAFEAAQKKVQTGDYTFDVDIAELEKEAVAVPPIGNVAEKKA